MICCKNGVWLLHRKALEEDRPATLQASVDAAGDPEACPLQSTPKLPCDVNVLKEDNDV